MKGFSEPVGWSLIRVLATMVFATGFSGRLPEKVCVPFIFVTGLELSPTDTDVEWMLADNLGTVRDVIDQAGQAEWNGHLTYDAYGQILSGGMNLTRYLYTGRDFDFKTGLQYNRERWYDPHTGRFTTQDPSGLKPDSNPYRYVGNSPTNHTDPSGLVQDVGMEWPGWGDYWRYLTNPSDQDLDIRIGQGCAVGVAGVAGAGATAIGTGLIEINVLSGGNVIKIISRPLQCGWRMDPAHHGQPWGHMHWWRW